MAEDEKPKETGAASILGKDPKKRQMVALGLGVAVLLGVYLLMRRGSASTAASTSTNPTVVASDGVTASGPTATDQDLLAQYATNNQAQLQQLNQGITGDFQQLTQTLQGMDASQPGAPPTGQQDVLINGRDEGPYMYGSNQINFIQGNLGQYGYTQGILQNVQDAYNVIAQQFGTQAAESTHYSWMDPTTVEAIPQGIVNQNQIYTVHLNGAAANAGGSIVNLAGQHEAWPTIWTSQIQPGVTNPTASSG